MPVRYGRTGISTTGLQFQTMAISGHAPVHAVAVGSIVSITRCYRLGLSKGLNAETRRSQRNAECKGFHGNGASSLWQQVHGGHDHAASLPRQHEEDETCLLHLSACIFVHFPANLCVLSVSALIFDNPILDKTEMPHLLQEKRFLPGRNHTSNMKCRSARCGIAWKTFFHVSPRGTQ